MTKVLVLGAGMVGSVIAYDLAADFDVAIADNNGMALQRVRDTNNQILTIAADLSLPDQIRCIAKNADIVIGALPSTLGFAALGAVIETGKPYVDISFMEEDPRYYDQLARRNGVTAIVDCGIAPGISNILAGYATVRLDPCERISIYVGGIPNDPQPPFYYKAAFAPSDVVQEYLRPARIVENSKIVVRDALTEAEAIFFHKFNKFNLEAFNTDGLRTLLSLDVPNMVEKTIRLEGHAKMMSVFRDAGFFDSDPVVVRVLGTLHHVHTRPIDMTQALLFPHWQYKPGEEDLTLFKVVASNDDETIMWEIIDRAVPHTGFSSMARTTAFPATIIARMLANKSLVSLGPGVIPPEIMGQRPMLFARIMEQLRRKGIDIQSSIIGDHTS